MHTQPMFAKAGRPNVGCSLSRKPWEIHPDFHGTDIDAVEVLVGPTVVGLSKEERGGGKWPIWYTARTGTPIPVPTDEAECMNKMTALGLFEHMSGEEVDEVREYVRSIPRALKRRTRRCFWVTPLQITRVQFDLVDFTRERGLVCPRAMNCNWKWLKRGVPVVGQ